MNCKKWRLLFIKDENKQKSPCLNNDNVYLYQADFLK